MLLSSGAGMITIKDDVMIRFNELLCRMYDTGEKEEVKTFLYNNAIFGLDWFYPTRFTNNEVAFIYIFHCKLIGFSQYEYSYGAK